MSWKWFMAWINLETSTFHKNGYCCFHFDFKKGDSVGSNVIFKILKVNSEFKAKIVSYNFLKYKVSY